MDGRSGRGVRALDGGFGRCVPMSCRRYVRTQLFGKMIFLRSVDLRVS